jgi:hypothetical protein
LEDRWIACSLVAGKAFAHDERAIKARRAIRGGEPAAARPVARRRAGGRDRARPDVPVNVDDRPRLEFGIARNIRVGDINLVERR